MFWVQNTPDHTSASGVLSDQEIRELTPVTHAGGKMTTSQALDLLSTYGGSFSLPEWLTRILDSQISKTIH